MAAIMDQAAGHQDQFVFHLTGQITGDGLQAITGMRLRPAVLAAYGELDQLRHDFPLVLIEPLPDEGEAVVSLAALVNRMLAELAPRGIEGERLRRHVLRLERELRAMVSAGAQGRLSDLWAEAVARLPAGPDDAAQVLAHAGAALRIDGELIGCDARLPRRFVLHQWRQVQMKKSRRLRQMVERVSRQLSDILRAAFVHSAAGNAPAALAASVGAPYAEVFDFARMSQLVARALPRDELPPARRARIEAALAVLREAGVDADPAADQVFDNCAAAAAAYRVRLPQQVEVLKALAIGELEAQGAYLEARHEPIFASYDESSVTAEELALFPDYLVLIPASENDAPANAGLLDLLSSGLPVKVLVEIPDLIEEAVIGAGHFAFGVRAARLATTAMGLGGMFVLQAPASHLYALASRVEHGLESNSPALLTVHAGSANATPALPPQLTAAMAMDARAFPAFSYDAAGGSHWADRFSMAGNRDPELDWPLQPLEYADEQLQRVVTDVAVSYADFALCDSRQARHFALLPRSRWSPAQLPAADWLALPEAEAAQFVPYVWVVDEADRLFRALVDARVMAAMRRCRLLWNRLQEHAGIHDAYAERLLARERAQWEAQAAAVPANAPPDPAEPATPEQATAITPPEACAAPERDPDMAWIETSRCPSCNECQLINPRMFGYNENKQAFIKDLAAGSYRQLVEAAESCQVAIIHPGKPRDPAEAGLAELLERARPFM